MLTSLREERMTLELVHSLLRIPKIMRGILDRLKRCNEPRRAKARTSHCFCVLPYMHALTHRHHASVLNQLLNVLLRKITGRNSGDQRQCKQAPSVID